VYLRDCWYAAAWPEEITAAPLRRTILDEPIALYRLASGDPVALLDRCPHRFVPLSCGSVVADELQCAYHGLRFDRHGMCVANPDGNHTIPPGARVQAFPLRRHCGLLWIWMGDPERADATGIPDLETFGDTEHYRFASGYAHVSANYQLITDNLLDLSHVQFLHPQLKAGGNFTNRREVRQEGERVWSMSWRYGGLPNAFWQRVWPADKPADRHTHMRWDPPSLMLLDSGIVECGAPESEAITRPTLHILTPETMTTTHYFWSFRCAAGSDDEVEAARAVGIQAFQNEDRPIIEAQQANLVGTDWDRLGRGMLNADAAAIRARKVLHERLSRQVEPAAFGSNDERSLLR
jgi:phenylpropionate dioxygenase-like ring-hydroxylating dioxygenase large terminal subunit